MNAATGTLTGIDEVDNNLLSFYRLRSEILDHFADIEAAILTYLSENQEKSVCDTAPLGHKIEAAKKIPAGPNRSKALKTGAEVELNKIAAILNVRAGLVHSRMEIAITTKNRIVAIFQNVKNSTTDDQNAMIFTLPQLQKFAQSLQSASSSLEQALTARNPKSPPRAK
jgi:hypothetical protein